MAWERSPRGSARSIPTNYTPMLNPDLPERIWFYDIDKKANTAMFKANDSGFTVAIPLHPFLGCLGVAPPGGEARMSITPGEWGGNLDSPQVSVGHTVYLPVNVPGALLYFGDGHAAQGEGEIAGTGIEVPMKVRLSVDADEEAPDQMAPIRKRHSLMAVGAYRPVDDALRIAFRELIAWIHAGLRAVGARRLRVAFQGGAGRSQRDGGPELCGRRDRGQAVFAAEIAQIGPRVQPQPAGPSSPTQASARTVSSAAGPAVSGAPQRSGGDHGSRYLRENRRYQRRVGGPSTQG